MRRPASCPAACLGDFFALSAVACSHVRPPVHARGSRAVLLLCLLALCLTTKGDFGAVPCDPATPSTCVHGTCNISVSNECQCRAGKGGWACQYNLTDIQCPPSTWAVDHGTVACDATRAFNTTCKLVCISGYALVGVGVVSCTFRGEWSRSELATCVPVCDPPCINGTCNGPDECLCKEGYAVTAQAVHACVPTCTAKPCRNGGLCTRPDTCSCPAGFIGIDCATAEQRSLFSRLTSASQPFNPKSWKFYVTWLLVLATLAIICYAVSVLLKRRRARRTVSPLDVPRDKRDLIDKRRQSIDAFNQQHTYNDRDREHRDRRDRR